MGRWSDKDRILVALAESGGMSNRRLRDSLDIEDKKYFKIRDELIDANLAEKYRAQHGGVRLTFKGERQVKELFDDSIPSNVSAEKDLYAPLVSYLEEQAKEDDVHSVAIDTSALKKSGKWQNPDVVQVSVKHFEYLKRCETKVTTYEVKQWGRWDVSVVFEAASHRRFSHDSVVVLEWPKDAGVFSLTDPNYRIDEIARECQRFGVGLYTMQLKYKKQWRLQIHVEAVSNGQNDEDMDEFLSYIFARRVDKREAYLKMLNG